MTVRRMHSIIAVFLTLAVAGFFMVSSIQTSYAQVDPSASEEQAKAAQAESGQAKSTDSGSSSKAKKKSTSSQSSSSGSSGSSSTDNDPDEDVLDENAFTTQGNARLGDVISDSSTKDFYTIRTENDNTYYLVIDHAGNMDNVYLLSTIDEDDLQDFLNNGGSSGTVILPEIQTQEETKPETETVEKETENNRMSGIISLIVILVAAVAGVVIFLRRKNATGGDEEYISEHMEDDMIPTVNEDEEFLE